MIASYWRAGLRSAQKNKPPGAFLTTYAPGGKTPAEGELFRNPDLADTYTLARWKKVATLSIVA